jgi:predicted nucleic acid-binding protein
VIVVDTSVLIDFFRGTPTSGAERLAQLEADEVPFSIPLICYQELLQGAKDAREWTLLDEHLQTQRLLVPEQPLALHREAARIFFDCRRRGITVRSTVDCLIAAQALQTKATLLHNDEDFERMSAVRPLKTLRA